MNKISGVYRITCTKTGKVYIGSSVDVLKRWSWHRFILRANSPMIGYGLTRPHPCQQDFNIHGGHSFEYAVIEECEKSTLREREQFWMDHPDYRDRYNYDVKANGSKKLSEQSRAWMSEAAKERNARPNYNKLISDRAREQHEQGRLGWKTRKAVTNRIPSNAELVQLKEWLTVNCEEGLIWWAQSNYNGKIQKGEPVGSNTGRSKFFLNKQSYDVDSTVWYFKHGEWPVTKPYHVNDDLSDDRIENLSLTKGEGKTRSTYPGV